MLLQNRLNLTNLEVQRFSLVDLKLTHDCHDWRGRKRNNFNSATEEKREHNTKVPKEDDASTCYPAVCTLLPEN